MHSVELMQRGLREAFDMVRTRLQGLTDEEFFWEPVPGCWTVYLDSATGRWTAHYAEPDPDPAPITTIGWRLVHIAQCKVMYHEYAFGPGRLTWWNIDYPHTADAAIAMLEEGQSLLEADLFALSDGDLDEPRATNWGEIWPAWRIFWTMVHHDLHHGAEIGVLRDLYRVGNAGSAAG